MLGSGALVRNPGLRGRALLLEHRLDGTHLFGGPELHVREALFGHGALVGQSLFRAGGPVGQVGGCCSCCLASSSA